MQSFAQKGANGQLIITFTNAQCSPYSLAPKQFSDADDKALFEGKRFLSTLKIVLRQLRCQVFTPKSLNWARYYKQNFPRKLTPRHARFDFSKRVDWNRPQK